MKRFRDLSILSKLAIAFALMGLLLVGMGVLSVRSIIQLNERIDTLYPTHILPTAQLDDLRAASFKMQTAIAWHILAYGSAMMKLQESEITALDEAFHEQLKSYAKHVKSREEQALYDDIKARWREIQAVQAKVLQLSTLYSKDAAAELQRGEGTVQLVAFTVAIQRLIELNKNLLAEEHAINTRLVSDIIYYILLITIGGLACGLFLGWTIFQKISVDLTNIVTATIAMRAGDLQARANLTTQDEIGQLALAFNEMAGKIEADVAGVLEAKHTMIAINHTYSIIEFDLQGTIIDANENFLRLSGYDKDELIGSHHRIFCDPTYVKSNDYAAFWQRLGQGHFETGTYQRVTKGGKSIWLQTSYNPTLNANGEIYKIVKFATDITAQKEAEIARYEQEAHLQAIVSNAVDGIVTINDRGIIESFNIAAERMFGYTSAEAIGQNVKLLMPEPYRSEHDGYLDNYKRTGHRKIIGIGREVVGKRKDGSTFPLDLAVSEIQFSNRRAFAGILRDVTDRRASETKLEQAAIQMECINLELEMANDEVREATEAKSNFLASMSHEIRTPMNSIVGMAQLLGETSLTPEQQDYTRRLRRASDHLLELINDILDLSKIESGHLELETVPVNLHSLMENIGEMMAVRAHAKPIDFVVRVCPGLPEVVSGDPTRLRQILVNLVGNAIKFTEAGQVLVQVEPAESGQFRFSVSDTGIGIPAEKLGSIFNSFSQADTSTTRKYGGTGLGLSICKRLVELMDGDISVTSTPNVGSNFVFTVPLPVIPLSTTSADPNRLALQGTRILVVDDHQLTRLVIAEILSEAGALVNDAASGPLAIAHLQTAQANNQPVQLMIVDHRMSDMDGLELMNTVRRMPTGKDLPVLFLISDTQPSDRARMQEFGISHQIIKPVSRLSLLMTARDAIMGQSAPAMLSLDQDPPPTRASLRPLRILVVDDLEDNRDLVILFLKNLPYALETAENGVEAVEKIQTNSYDIVLMDVQMPIMDGLQATATIRQWERAQGRPPVPIVALTAQALAEEREKSLAAGYTAHLTKPIKKPDLLKAIEGHTGLIQDQAA
ncbi:MAG TPA: PAS domain S-box protein [Nitrospira sp.]|nr:PAS domain S-box protein [Nitrospira sp.]